MKSGSPELDHLKDYQKRENRQSWSDYYHRLRSTSAELLADSEVISDASLVRRLSSTDFLYKYVDSEIKVREDSRVDFFAYRLDNYEPVAPLTNVKLKQIDPLLKTMVISFSDGRAVERICLLPSAPLSAHSISDSIASYTRYPARYPAPTAILNRSFSQLSPNPVKPLVSHNDPLVDDIINRAVNLDNSFLTIQGPPGTGKTYVGARVILELILQGRRVGVMALSHKAINNLLEAVDALLDVYQVRGAELIKSRSKDNPVQGFSNIRIGDIVGQVQKSHLVAGTVYSFSRMPDHVIDTLVIDEAGQIPLAWIMAAGRTARNILLMGDHRQLPQVSQSLHPEGSGESVLEYLIGNQAVIPAEYGNFLDITRRMNPEITHFISDLMYDGKLNPHPQTSSYILKVPSAHPALDSRGISWIEMEHEGCSQESREEADEILRIVNELQIHEFDLKEILIIAPYRAQEALIRSLLPKQMSEQIGTVDRFQGREADIVIFSMTSSDGMNLPRDIDFLFSLNRLNVALSRARCKAIVLANRRLLTVTATTLDQLKSVNALCRLKHYCERGGSLS